MKENRNVRLANLPHRDCTERAESHCMINRWLNLHSEQPPYHERKQDEIYYNSIVDDNSQNSGHIHHTAYNTSDHKPIVQVSITLRLTYGSTILNKLPDSFAIVMETCSLFWEISTLRSTTFEICSRPSIACVTTDTF